MAGGTVCVDLGGVAGMHSALRNDACRIREDRDGAQHGCVNVATAVVSAPLGEAVATVAASLRGRVPKAVGHVESLGDVVRSAAMAFVATDEQAARVASGLVVR